MRERIPLQIIVRVIGIVLSTIVVILIFIFSFMPKEAYPEISWIPFADTGDHMVAYAALGFSLFFAFLQIPGSGKPHKRVPVPHSTLHLSSWSGSAVIASLVIGTLLGIVVELVQPVFDRSREWLDLAADFMGLVVGLAVALLVLKAVGSYFATRPWLYDPNWKDEVDETLKNDQRRATESSSRT